jgi:diaminopimelate decarboxylase
MNKSNINPQNWELMLDPYIIHRDEDREELDDGVFFVGNLCLESDFIYKHKTFLDKKPEEDDLVVFVNTAAYHMDFGESRTIQHDTADKIAVYGDNQWKKDELYTGEETE